MSNKFIFLSLGLWIFSLYIVSFFVYLIPIRDVIFTDRIWANFDGVHYLNIAYDGYTNQARFFPMFPILIWLLVKVSGLSFFISGLVLSNLFFLLALMIFNKLLLLDYKADVVKQVLIYLIVFPAAFFFGVIYSESLFLLLLVLSFYFARKSNFLMACFLGALLTATRFVGVFVIVGILVEILTQKEKRSRILNSGYLLVVPLGVVFYSVFNYIKWGDPFRFITAQGELYNSRTVSSLVFPLQTVFRYLKILFSFPVSQYEWWGALIEVATFIFGSVMLFFAYKCKVRLSYLIFSVLAFLLPGFSGTFSGLPRYILIAFPIFIGLALIKSRIVKGVYVISAIVLQMIMFMLFARGYYIA